MYCPQCSQQQVSEETKFCSRCGFPLGLVSELLAHGGFLPQLADLYKSKGWLTKRNGVAFSGFWLIFFSLLTILFRIADFDELAGASVAIGIFGGLIWLIASLVFLKSAPKNSAVQMNELPSANVNAFAEVNQKVLPPQQSQPAQSYIPPASSWKAPDTGELAHPRSVTEGTTKLLQKDEL